MLFSFGFIQAQIINGYDLKKLTPEQRKDLINNLTPEQKKEFYEKLKTETMMDDLKIDDAKKEEFKKLYDEYQESQKKIKSGFNSNFDASQLSEEEAKKKLDESFNVGQQLMENRKKYSKEMQKVMSPQQILKMFQNEGTMREKMMERRNNSNQQSRTYPNSNRSNSGSGIQRSGGSIQRQQQSGATTRTRR